MKYLKNTSWLFFEKILRMAVGLFVGVWVARYLGPERFGLFSYAQSFVGLFVAFSTLGLDGLIVQELVKNKHQTNTILATSFWLKVFGGLITILFLSIAVNFTNHDNYTNKIIFIIASSVIFQSFNVIDFYFQSKVLSKYIVFTNAFSLLLSSLIKVFLILNNAPLIAFVWVVLFDNIILALGFVYFYFKTNKTNLTLKFSFNTTIALSLLKKSWPILFSAILVGAYMKVDQIMIKHMLNNASIGQYAAAVRLSEIFYFIPLLVSSSLFPAIINAKKISTKLYFQRLQNLYTLLIWIAIAIALPISFLSDFIINLFYGDTFLLSSKVLLIHIWSGVLVFFIVARHKWILLENLQKYELLINFTCMSLNILFNYILIPKFGIYGAALATLFAYFISSIVMCLFIQKLKISLLMYAKAFIYPLSLKKGFHEV